MHVSFPLGRTSILAVLGVAAIQDRTSKEYRILIAATLGRGIPTNHYPGIYEAKTLHCATEISAPKLWAGNRSGRWGLTLLNLYTVCTVALDGAGVDCERLPACDIEVHPVRSGPCPDEARIITTTTMSTIEVNITGCGARQSPPGGPKLVASISLGATGRAVGRGSFLLGSQRCLLLSGLVLHLSSRCDTASPVESWPPKQRRPIAAREQCLSCGVQIFPDLENLQHL